MADGKASHSRLKNNSMGWRPFSRRSEYSFLQLLEDAHASGLIFGNFREIAGEALSIYPTAKTEAENSYAMEALARKLDNPDRRERMKTFAGRLDRFEADLRGDLDELERLWDDVDSCGEIEDLDAIDAAMKRRSDALDAVTKLRAVLDEPRLASATKTVWEERYYFRQVADWWRTFEGAAHDEGMKALADIAAALWRDMGGEIPPRLGKDNPDRVWAKEQLRKVSSPSVK